MSKKSSYPSLVAALVLTGVFLPAQQAESTVPGTAVPGTAVPGTTVPGTAAPEAGALPQDPAAPPAAEADLATLLADFHPKSGTISLKSHGQVALGDGWLWLDGSDGQRFLVELGNRQDPRVNGVAIEPDYLQTGIFAVYSHSEEGHVDDEEPDYDELMQSMRDGEEADNQARKKVGVATVQMLGWAEPPHYDQAGHKLYWATKLQFEGNNGPTLNYNVRVLGRTSTIDMIGVGDFEQLPKVATRCKELLAVTEFVASKRYSDFDPEYDKIAAYGIGGLIAGKVALKIGLFAKLGVLLLKFLKPILVGVALIGGLLFKALGGRKATRQRVRGSAAGGPIVDRADDLK